MSDPQPTNWAAGRYQAVAERIAVIAGEVVAAADRLRPVRDTALVDLACGTGSAALAAAGAGARVTGVDLTAELIAVAAGRPGADAVQWVVADAAHTGLPDGGFATAVSNMGIIFVEPAGLVAEVTRLLTPGGVFAFSTWVRDEAGSPFFNPIVETLGQPPASAYSPDQWGDPDIVRSRLTSGFDQVHFETGSHTWQFDSVESAVRFIAEESPMHVDLLSRLDETTRTRLLDAFTAALTAQADSDGQVAFVAPYAVVTARRKP
ncbi:MULTISPECIES: class I SAM-dependent methyltransferase [unclassified Mycolicibacterium]|uniref:class I SAM-dependent methyltransferase n=1 Tax=unclassified Mycolicibacterium TaxID=2636767 RepID=UPI0012DDB2CF|nr:MULTISPECIES: class I SAM-dependent methyltransferase [unclassified Mycolicibacterium]MUL80996.1 class I SAM-dependent methyltransferase [Mycolicibacterium sp. CBMA 329]MUL86762.1 class I SAM-dependent methyltransferase [Mycolicibacterium sp. CBMA 331]MUL98953.1 class I SAM-dependent methyltransferase [Mycolicibacterium sp. CBMA 334]MUM28136.1 class I SAM-dependent methyltransferase [Mycolicibacterium sp. CBMA 295]MUM37059.1 class I SAM-dependent methyltransferase [Mycolicibacterium sp. CBM